MPHFFDMKNALKAGRVAAQGDQDLSERLSDCIRGVDSIAMTAKGYGEKLSEGADMVKVDVLMSKLSNTLVEISKNTLKDSSEHRSGPSAPAP